MTNLFDIGFADSINYNNFNNNYIFKKMNILKMKKKYLPFLEMKMIFQEMKILFLEIIMNLKVLMIIVIYLNL